MGEVLPSWKCLALLPTWQSQANGWPSVLGMLKASALETRAPGPGPAVPKGVLATARDSSMPLGSELEGGAQAPSGLPVTREQPPSTSRVEPRISPSCWKTGEVVN